MQSPDQIIADIRQNWLLYASMPLVAAATGYVTKLVAIRMMFEPVEFVGPRPLPRLAGDRAAPRRWRASRATR